MIMKTFQLYNLRSLQDQGIWGDRIPLPVRDGIVRLVCWWADSGTIHR
jgi:hypothetical protein